VGQRVTIQYSIDIDNLPNEVKRLVDRVDHEINTLQGVKWSSDPFTPATGELIAETRESLSAIDHMLQDIDVIISGYLQYKAGTRAAEQTPETLPADEIQERLSEFRAKMGQLDNEVTD
jgi:hypothetical protein